MKQQRKYSYFSAMLLCLLLSCDDKLDWIQKSPEVFGVSPNTGLAGDIVIISGDAFSTIVDQNTVTINGITATIISATATTLEVEVPPGTTGPVIVTVNGRIAKNKPTFTYRIIPVIDELTPNSGIVGSEIVISGSNFSTNASENTVTINGTTAMIVSATATTLTVIAPEESSGVVVVTVNGEQSGEDPTFIYEPEIFSISPLEGRAGTILTITGRNFGATPAENDVMLGTTSVAVTTATTTTLTLVVPEFPYPQPLATGVSVGGYEAATKPEFNLEFLVSTLPIAPFSDRIMGLERDALGNLYVTVNGQSEIYKVAPNGSVTVFADASDGLMRPIGLSLNDAGNLVVVDSQGSAVFTISPTGVVLKTVDIGPLPGFHDVCTSGTSVFVVEITNFRVIVIDDMDNISTFADLGAGSGAYPLGLALSLDENDNIILFIPGRSGELYKYEDLDGSLELLPFVVSKFDVETDSENAIYGMGAPLGLLKIIKEAGMYVGHILVDDGNGSIDGLTSVATVSEITAFTSDENNVLYFADFDTHTIRKVEK